jgi:hypothetical protein
MFIFLVLDLSLARSYSQLAGRSLCDLTNIYRIQNGLPELQLSYTMEYIAEYHLNNLIINNHNIFDGTCVMHSWYADGVVTPCCYSVSNAALNKNCMTSKPREITAKWPYGYNASAAENAYGSMASGFGSFISADRIINSWKMDIGHRSLLLHPLGKVCGAVLNETYKTSYIQNIALLWIGIESDSISYDYDGDPMDYISGLTTSRTSVAPTVAPSLSPTIRTSIAPTVAPSLSPTIRTSIAPTVAPSLSPTIRTSIVPTIAPSLVPTIRTSIVPTIAPSLAPTIRTSIVPTIAPSLVPTLVPIARTSIAPTYEPSIAPTLSTIEKQTPTDSPAPASTSPTTVKTEESIAIFIFIISVIVICAISICVYKYYNNYNPEDSLQTIRSIPIDFNEYSQRYDRSYFKNFRRSSLKNLPADERFIIEYYRRVRKIEKKMSYSKRLESNTV